MYILDRMKQRSNRIKNVSLAALYIIAGIIYTIKYYRIYSRTFQRNNDFIFF